MILAIVDKILCRVDTVAQDGQQLLAVVGILHIGRAEDDPTVDAVLPHIAPARVLHLLVTIVDSRLRRAADQLTSLQVAVVVEGAGGQPTAVGEVVAALLHLAHRD